MTGPSITASTTIAAVIGSPIGHSLSPVLHNAAFEAAGLDWVYAAFDVDESHGAEAVAAMRVLGLGGLSVTMPCKQAVVGAVDELSPDAAALGAVNCVRWDGNRLVGENFDGQGFVTSLREIGVDPAGLRCAILGAGGAARAVGVGLLRAGADAVVIVNRSAANADKAVAVLGARADVGSESDLRTADLIVDSTPLGMDPADPLPLDVTKLHADQIVADLVYHPLRTPLLLAAQDRGCRTLNGLGMLIHQAGNAFTAWTGRDAPVDAMRSAVLGGR